MAVATIVAASQVNRQEQRATTASASQVNWQEQGATTTPAAPILNDTGISESLCFFIIIVNRVYCCLTMY